MMQVKVVLLKACEQLNNEEARLEVQLLLMQVLNVNHAWLISHADDEISPADDSQYQALIERRLKGEPIAYILGERAFYGLALKVTPDTLIPRPDTETLVAAALAKIPPSATHNILDLGSGDHSQRIRTYNYPQGRITDHRINLTLYKIDAITEGDLDALINPLAAEHQADMLAILGEDN